MIRKSTWILLGVFALSLAALWALKGPAKEWVSEPTATVKAEIMLLDVAEEEISALQVEMTGVGAARLERNLDDEWVLVEPQTEATDTTSAGLTIKQVASLSVVSALKTTPPDETSGLDAPSSVITIELKDGSSQTITVGASTPVGNGYYVRLNDDPQVYAVSKSGIDYLNELVISPPIVTAEPDPGAAPTAGAAQ